MLPDPLKLMPADPTLVAVSLSVGSLATRDAVLLPPKGDGRTVRNFVLASGLLATLTITSGDTKESKPYGTKRTTVRIDMSKFDAETGHTVTGFFQQTVGFPKAFVTAEEIREVVVIGTQLLLVGDADGEDMGYVNKTTGATFLNRITAGEG